MMKLLEHQVVHSTEHKQAGCRVLGLGAGEIDPAKVLGTFCPVIPLLGKSMVGKELIEIKFRLVISLCQLNLYPSILVAAGDGSGSGLERIEGDNKAKEYPNKNWEIWKKWVNTLEFFTFFHSQHMQGMRGNEPDKRICLKHAD